MMSYKGFFLFKLDWVNLLLATHQAIPNRLCIYNRWTLKRELNQPTSLRTTVLSMGSERNSNGTKAQVLEHKTWVQHSRHEQDSLGGVGESRHLDHCLAIVGEGQFWVWLTWSCERALSNTNPRNLGKQCNIAIGYWTHSTAARSLPGVEDKNL